MQFKGNIRINEIKRIIIDKMDIHNILYNIPYKGVGFMEAVVSKWGNSSAVRIPKQYLVDLGG